MRTGLMTTYTSPRSTVGDHGGSQLGARQGVRLTMNRQSGWIRRAEEPRRLFGGWHAGAVMLVFLLLCPAHAFAGITVIPIRPALNQLVDTTQLTVNVEVTSTYALQS